MKLSKSLSLLIVLLVYATAFFVGLLVFRFLPFDDIWRFLCADAAATVVVWFFGLVFKNASLYDPYWSVAPPVLLISFMIRKGFADTVDLILLGVLLFWGIRLTLNWIIGWRGMVHQDWRYTMLKQQKPKLWPITNFFGINMMPTLIVFANMIPAYVAVSAHKQVNIAAVIGTLLCVLSVLLQIVSDWQMRRFRLDSAHSGHHIESGLWKHSRHPNYLGEVAFWWGIFVIQISSVPSYWWTVAAPVLMTMLFLGISIPMMEKRLLQTKQGYAAYIKRTSALLLWPQKKSE